MHKAGVIGDKNSVLAFKAVGMEVRPASTPAEAEAALEELAKAGCAAIFITEDAALSIPEAIARYRDMTLPAIVPIPSTKGVRGMGAAEVRRWVERAVGADILSK
jgi:V/A-type H+-transporting ATPase subunit F